MTIEHSQRAHSPLGASAAYRWMNCPGSYALCATLPPSPDSPSSRDGTLMHEWAEFALKNKLRSLAAYVGKRLESHGNADKALTKEFAGIVETYAGYVLDFAKQPGAVLEVETRVALHDIDADLTGTNDAKVYIPDVCELHVFDLKTGVAYVDERNNPQCNFYGYGAYLAHKGDVKTVVVHIIQPRSHGEPIRHQRMHISELIEWSFELEDAVKAAKATDAQCKAGPWCDKNYCTAKSVCPALRNDFEFLPVIDLQNASRSYDVPNAELADLATYAKRFDGAESFIKAVRERLTAAAFAGEKVPGFKLVQGAGKRAWNIADGDEATIARTLGEYTEPYNKKLIGITDAEKALGKKKFAELCADLVTKKLPRPALVPESDKRPAWTGDAGDEFSAVTLEGFEE